MSGGPFDDRIDDLLDDRLRGAAPADLDEAARASAAVRADLEAQELIHRLLRAVHSPRGEPALVVRVMTTIRGDAKAAANRVMVSRRFLRQARRRRSRFHPWPTAVRWATAACLLTAIGGLAWWALGPPATGDGPGATPIVAAATIELGDGAELVPAEGQAPALLRRGHADISVPPQPGPDPWRIATPHGVISVHGTRFTVDVAEETTRIHLHHGRITFAGMQGVITGPKDLSAPGATFAISASAAERIATAMRGAMTRPPPARSRRVAALPLPLGPLPVGARLQMLPAVPREGVALVATVRPQHSAAPGEAIFRMWGGAMTGVHTQSEAPGQTPTSLTMSCELRLLPLGSQLGLDWYDTCLLVDGRLTDRFLSCALPSPLVLSVTSGVPLDLQRLEHYALTAP